MECKVIRQKGGYLTRCDVESWSWTKNNGSYRKSRDFFSCHWEIQHDDSDVVLFHIESPREGTELVSSKLIPEPANLSVN